MKALNLKPHVCGATKSKTKTLCSAADIEGHCGIDNKVHTRSILNTHHHSLTPSQFYLLDFSRTMPPAQPDLQFHNGHLYRLLRYELVSKYPHPLCSDAYSGFIMHDKKLVRNRPMLVCVCVHSHAFMSIHVYLCYMNRPSAGRSQQRD